MNNNLLSPNFVSTLSSHSMEDDLLDYLEIKIHRLVKEGSYKRVVVVGEHNRKNAELKDEKTGKLSNFQRPTAKILDQTLFIYCFPGIDYVRHYSSLIASYFALSKIRDPKIVKYVLPSETEAWKPIISGGFEDLPKSDWLIFGSGLSGISSSTVWQESENFFWSEDKLGRKSVTFLSVKFSFWGDILERMTRYLVESGHKKIIYTAKVGGISKALVPNESLATGTSSFSEGELLTWKNIFGGISRENLIHGVHINSPSVLFENKDWLSFFGKFDFVDSEIGKFARGALLAEADELGYLHFVSNNLTILQEEGLSNERKQNVIAKREILKEQIKEILVEAINR